MYDPSTLVLAEKAIFDGLVVVALSVLVYWIVSELVRRNLGSEAEEEDENEDE